MEAIVHDFLVALGEDPDREGLRQTPARVARSWRELVAGAQVDPRALLRNAIVEEAWDQLVLCRDIRFYSLCEHHLLPFFGRCHVGYIPRGQVVGLSKLARLVEVFARRLQVQERMTRQIADALQDALEPEGVGVVVEATHLCTAMRGVSQENVTMTTSVFRGRLEVHAPSREEFMSHLRRTRD